MHEGHGKSSHLQDQSGIRRDQVRETTVIARSSAYDMMTEGTKRVRSDVMGKWLVGFANDSANRMVAKLSAGSIRRPQSTCRNLCRDQLAD